MKSFSRTGFTIIETMLFLGITALLIMGILMGTGTSINIQRYRDSVSSLQSELQQQYSEVANVDNDNDGNFTCYKSGSVMPRGQSTCLILGKYITTSDDSSSLEIKTVLGGVADGTEITSSSDIEAFKLYDINVSPMNVDIYDLEWGASLVDTHGNPMTFSMLILRSPSSGVIRTFIDPGTIVSDDNIKDILNLVDPISEIKTCVDSNGLFTGARSAILITENATSSSGIETLGESSGC